MALDLSGGPQAETRDSDHSAAPPVREPAPLPSGIGEVLLHWTAMQEQTLVAGSTAYNVIVAVLVLIIGYAVLTDSLLMAIVFILIGLVGHLSISRGPEERSCALTDRGILIDREFYEYNHIRSYWITESETGVPPEFIIHTDGNLVDRHFIPLGDGSPSVSQIDACLADHLRKRRYDPGIIDTIGKIMHI